MESTATQAQLKAKERLSLEEPVNQTTASLQDDKMLQCMNLQPAQTDVIETTSSVLSTPKLINGKSRSNNFALTATNTNQVRTKKVTDKFKSFYLEKG